MAHPFKVGGLGEIAIRCANLPEMVAFYRDIVGLKLLIDSTDGIVFFELPGGVAGHTTVLALFRYDVGRAELHGHGKAAPETGVKSSLHHIALSLSLNEQKKAIAFYDANSVPYQVQTFDWIGWRGVFTSDPEGNTVELVAYSDRYLAANS